MEQKKDNIFKRWYRLCEPNKKYWFFQIFWYIIHVIFLTIITIFAAKTINCMYAKNWTGSFTFLGIELLTIILRNIAMHIEYKYYGLSYGWVRVNVNKKVYDKLMSCENAGIKKLSKEKIISIATNNTGALGEFPESVASFVAYIVQVVITLTTVYISNWLAGLIVTLLGFVNFFVYFSVNKKLGKILVERYEKKDDLFVSYNKVIEGKAVIKEFKREDKYAELVTRDEKNFSRAYAHYYNVYSFKNNIWFACWNVIIYAVAALMMYYVSNRTMDISVYLIIVPYLSTCTDKLNTLFDKTKNIEDMRVDVDRIEMILNMNDDQLAKYGEFNNDSPGYNLGLIDVTVSEKDSKTKLENIDLSFKIEDINIVRGDRGSGKRMIFNMLRRNLRPDSGNILLDNLDLYDYSDKTFKQHINYSSSHPPFISGTVKENLMMSEKRFDKVKKTCDKLGITQEIELLPLGFNTQILDITSGELLFFLGIARALLTNCKILMIYEVPQVTSEYFKYHFEKVLQKIAIERTVILFTHSDEYDHLAKMVYEVKDGDVHFVAKANLVKSEEEQIPMLASRSKAKKIASSKNKKKTEKS